MKGSTGKVIAYAPTGRRLAEFPLEGRAATADPARNFVWACSSDGLTRLTGDAQLDDRFPLAAYTVSVEPDTGYVWAGTMDGVYRLDPSGKPVWQDVESGKSQKWVCVIPMDRAGKVSAPSDPR